MGKVLKKSFVLILSVVMLFTLFSCAKDDGEANTTTEPQKNETESKPEGTTEKPAEELKEVDVKAYLLGEPPLGYEEVYEEVNKILKSSLKATLKMNFISMGERRQKYPLILASGEKFDLVYTAGWTYFVEQSQKGAFKALDQLLPKNAPELFNFLPDEAKKQGMVDGTMYMVPSTNVMPEDNGFMVRGDLRKKYGLPEIKSMDDFEEYLKKVKENEPEIVPYHAGSNDVGRLGSILVFSNDWTHSGFNGGIFSMLDTDYQNIEKDVFAWYFTPEFEAFVKRMREWSQMGLWTKNALTNKITAKESLINGSSASTITNLDDANTIYKQTVQNHPEWEVEWFPIEPDTAFELSSYRKDGFSVAASSKNPERALMVLEKLTLDRELYDLCFYGIEGKHYILDDKGRLSEGSHGVFAGEDISIWGFRNPELKRYATDLMPGYIERKESMINKALSNNLAAFTFDTSNIKSELSAIRGVQREYGHPLIFGMIDNVDEGLETVREKLTQVGVKKVLEEARTQCQQFAK